MEFYDTTTPYDVVDYKGIQYTTCRDFNHISRYKGLRQVIHSPNDVDERFISLETSNPFTTRIEVMYYDVPVYEENRLDLIAHKYLGSASYSWVLAYLNQIEDGFTVRQGQTLKIPKSLFNLFNNGEILASIPALQLNLSSE